MDPNNPNPSVTPGPSSSDGGPKRVLLRDQTGECLDCGRPTRYSGHSGYPFANRCPACEYDRRRTVDRDEVVRLRRDHNLTSAEIAAYLGCSQPRVSLILIEHGYGLGRAFRRGTFTPRRYVIRSVTGYALAVGRDTPHTSYSVLDSIHNYQEVACFYADDVRGEARRRRLAKRECARLNALDQLEVGVVF